MFIERVKNKEDVIKCDELLTSTKLIEEAKKRSKEIGARIFELNVISEM